MYTLILGCFRLASSSARQHVANSNPLFLSTVFPPQPHTHALSSVFKQVLPRLSRRPQGARGSVSVAQHLLPRAPGTASLAALTSRASGSQFEHGAVVLRAFHALVRADQRNVAGGRAKQPNSRIYNPGSAHVVIPQEAVLTVGEFCKLATESDDGSSLSFVGTVSTAINAFPPLHQVPPKTSMWPALVPSAASHSVRVFDLQPGGKDSKVWHVQGPGKTLSDMHVLMQDSHAIVFDDTCDDLTIQGAKFEGGVIVCQGKGCNVTIEDTMFSRSTLVVMDGASVNLRQVQCSADAERGSGISIMATGAQSTVRVSDVLVKGGLQGIAVHEGAVLEEDLSVKTKEETLTCIGQEIVGIECRDPGSALRLRSCEVRYVGHRWGPSYTSPEGVGVYVHSGSRATLQECRIDCCVVGVVAENAHVSARDCHMRLNTSAGILFEGSRGDDHPINGVLSNCVSRENGVGVAVGHGASIYGEFVVAVENSGDGFYVSSGTGGSAILHHCSAIQCKGSGVHVDGVRIQHDAVHMFFGTLIGNGEGHWGASGMRVRRGAGAVLEQVASAENSHVGFMCAHDGSRLVLMSCKADDAVPYRQWLGGEIVLHDCVPGEGAVEHDTPQ